MEAEVVPVAFASVKGDGESVEGEAVGAVAILPGVSDAVGSPFLEEAIGEGKIEPAVIWAAKNGDGGGVGADDFGAWGIGHLNGGFWSGFPVGGVA